MTSKEMKKVLAEQIQNLISGQTTAANMNAITNAVGKVISVYKLEIEVLKMTNRKPDDHYLEIENVNAAKTVTA